MIEIFVKKIEDKNSIFLNAEFIKQHNLKPCLVEFLQYFVSLQLAKGIDEWIIVKLEETAEKLNIPRPTLSRYLKQLEDENILVHEDFRSALWKINSHIILVAE